MHSDRLNPTQQDLIEQLRRPEELPSFDRSVRTRLREQLTEGLDAASAGLGAEDRLWVNKHKLAMIMGCERRYLAQAPMPFAWSVPTARGTIAHKAIELSVHLDGEPTPAELVSEAISSLADRDTHIAEWLQTRSDRELAELRSEANDSVAAFLECWPALKPAWRPVTEARLRYEHRSTIVLSGKVDLSLGRARGDLAGKVLVDLKTGGSAPQHLEDLRFYALLETLRVGTPPRLLAGYYLDQGRLQPEPVTEALLEAAVERVVDGVGRIIETGKRTGEPSTAPGPPCRWCFVSQDCEPGKRYLSGDDLAQADSEDDRADYPEDLGGS